MDTGFASCHPAVQMLFFVSVIAVTMTVMHPAVIAISLTASLLYMAYASGAKTALQYLKIAGIMSVMIIAVNPLISHNGITIIAYLPDGNPLTLESIVFGCVGAAMLSCSLFWFYSLNRVFTSDKVICLFGKIAPKFALLISMTLNFTEKFAVQLRHVQAVQASLGNSVR